MGLHDAEEMLEAAKADAVQLERDLTQARAERDAQIVETRRLQRAIDAVRRLAEDRDRDAIEADPIWSHEILAIIGQTPDLDEGP